MKYNKHRYYKIQEITREDKTVVYEVQAKDRKIERWIYASIYEKKNKTLDEALDHIKHLISLKLKSIKTVHIEKV